jgi:hypothetical protein
MTEILPSPRKEITDIYDPQQGATGMCLGGHLAFRCAFDKRIRAAVCYFATDIHSQTLGKGKNDDSIKRVKDISGELIMVRFVSSRLVYRFSPE